ncbi:hypothetical protein WJ0W_005034 [Paenibacillus melissococcoides]|uniref:Uncharacterized protein n=1 Tax=Paenibacillus melissococcoides TaxID=2912268 RepID=A0ABN8U9F8_9BACL|nr:MULTISPECIES: hypothetical protein [Paenibacillus]MEB9897310.1 hypothetical protein [Bacillus cereus]CAH8247777.1 hypothetical protein WJ0W_005034 [Paenibacillus melissococcoides]CAH8719571.1 hypothetical protein HTL2_005653 [Paenibacillus melissococcoides]CAH8720568.1 hypothetical protein WDD9_005926 [Paenibacillus melissococcoides]GIO82904.1 hypothetical protein J6TS7_65140 [Paenibacillus dendritiformis]
MNMEKFKSISLRGRVAYGISCFENALIASKYDLNDWKLVLKYLWEFTSIQYLDDWNDVVVELIPSNLMEFKTYEEHQFERLSKDEFLYLYNLYQYSDEIIDTLLRNIYDLGISHVYTVIEGYGESSLMSLERLINFMIVNNLPLPDIGSFLKFHIEENKGWGNKFDGTILSKVL